MATSYGRSMHDNEPVASPDSAADEKEDDYDDWLLKPR